MLSLLCLRVETARFAYLRMDSRLKELVQIISNSTREIRIKEAILVVKWLDFTTAIEVARACDIPSTMFGNRLARDATDGIIAAQNRQRMV
jgi:hypothetical protein